MPDLNAVAVLVAKPGSEAIVGAALRDLVAPTRQEEGCQAYELFESTAERGTFITIERWRGPADLDAHMQTDHVVAAITAAGDHLAAAPAVHPLEPQG